jgi:hypothetical protein
VKVDVLILALPTIMLTALKFMPFDVSVAAGA